MYYHQILPRALSDDKERPPLRVSGGRENRNTIEEETTFNIFQQKVLVRMALSDS